MKLSGPLLKELTNPQARLPWIKNYLINEVWSQTAYANQSPSEYLRNSESKTNEFEQIIASAASRVYDELVAESKQNPTSNFLQNSTNAAVIFDGLSIRELPFLYELAEKSGFRVLQKEVAVSAIPSDTLEYIEKTLAFGRISPSMLPNRKDIEQKGIKVYYYQSPAQKHRIEVQDKALLLWSSFPDQTYNDSGARFIQHFENNKMLLEEAWKNTVQQIPQDKKIVISSDHGYVFFGTGCSFTRNQEDIRPINQYFGGERFKVLLDTEKPLEHPDVYILEGRNVCLIKGRVQAHPPGQSGTKLYKHGGLSLMECLVPWIVLERK